ncbi:MAG: methyl-accepting chemotaxis protein [candidate division Zixibacteria bacterium]|nr:methyl-accepting chemotaxis protein [candidate division Zixibacteria bacterium]
MLRWNIRNQILGAGFTSLLVLVGVVAYFYVFTRGGFRDNSQDIISMVTSRHAQDIDRSLARKARVFDDWIKDDVFGLALEFNTTGELGEQMRGWVSPETGFRLVALIDRDDRIVEVAVAESITAGAASLKGRQLGEVRDLGSTSNRQVQYVNSRTLTELGVKDPSTYAFYKPALNSSGERNGGFVALTSWQDIGASVQDCSDELRRRGFSDARSLLAFPSTGFVATDASVGSGADAPLDVTQAVRWSQSADDGDVESLETDGESAFVSYGAIHPVASGDKTAESPALLVAVPEAAIMAQLNSQLIIILTIGLLGTLVVLVLNYVLASRISRRVTLVTNVAARMAVGDVEQTIDINSQDEIGSLAESFRKLIDYQKELGSVAERISANDLTVTFEPKSDKDMLGNAVKTMVLNFSGMIRQLADNARDLTSAATEIASSSEQMSRGAGEQSQQTVQVQGAVESVAASVLEAAENAGEATKVAGTASEMATEGGAVVSETIQGMQRIANVVRESAASIAKLSKSAEDIGQIISVIDDIADQTNLLALNAAIEAARAGEQGRGFAVVADEVRKLAERTGKATGEIGQMIKGIQSDTDEAVSSMEAGVQEVDKGRELADRAGTSLSEIVQLSQNVSRMVEEIASAAQQQQVATEQISTNIDHIASVTKETASGAEQSATAAEQLNRQAETLQNIVSQFRI